MRSSSQAETSQWPEPVGRVSAVLRAAAVDARIEEFAEVSPTAREAAEAIGCDLGQIVKSLVLVCDGAYVMALVPGDRRADLAAIGSALDASDVRVARPDEVVHATGFEPGAVAPFPQRAVTRTLIDQELLSYAVVWIGAGSTRHVASLPPVDLQRLSGAIPWDIATRG
jgi:prolyl-tRNA editing enzyme YbaK/EbsC (Cys-tRNA(Pro) deacylase)